MRLICFSNLIHGYQKRQILLLWFAHCLKPIQVEMRKALPSVLQAYWKTFLVVLVLQNRHLEMQVQCADVLTKANNLKMQKCPECVTTS
jgi:hypothetical protein